MSTAIPPNIDELTAYIGQAETSRLEFKSREALSRERSPIAEMVKDVSGLANAAGGRVVYGLAEARLKGRPGVASHLDPVIDAKVTTEWVTQVLRNNSAPPLQAFDVHEVHVPDSPDGGRLIVVDIDAGTTAHQSLIDCKYFQRVGTTTQAMEDYQIRDVMNRRRAPQIDVQIKRRKAGPYREDRHTYDFVPTLTNEGLLSLKEWCLEVEVPDEVDGDSYYAAEMQRGRRSRTVRDVSGRPRTRFQFEPAYLNGASGIIYPNQVLELDASAGVAPLRVEVDKERFWSLHHTRPPISWRLYMTNARPIEGEIPFDEWCIY